MTQDIDGRIVNEFAAGRGIPEIAARYAVPEEYVGRVVEDADDVKPKRWTWSINNWGNRLVYSILAGAVVNWSTGMYALGTVVAVVLFVLTTAILAVRRR